MAVNPRPVAFGPPLCDEATDQRTGVVVNLPQLGIVEGYFGRPWSWAERERVAGLVARHGFSFFLYAPKADAKLRRNWREPFDESERTTLASFAASCRGAGLRFGVGLSPYEVYLDFNAEARAALARKLAELDSIGIDDLGILFDDMGGGIEDLARREVEVAHFAAAHSKAGRIIVCPTYYTDDPVLDRAFGCRPANYLTELGRTLDPAIEIFWTGEEVCARAFSLGHLDRVTESLRRRPFLWDNYPVNDGPRMAQHLHLRAFTGRPAVMRDAVAAHAVNPALQPTLSCIPLLSLALSYERGDLYCYGSAFLEAAQEVVGEELAGMLQQDLLALQDTGLDRLDGRRARLRDRYACHDHPAAREVVAWLDGAYTTTVDEVQTQ